jgi:hypothetical protein
LFEPNYRTHKFASAPCQAGKKKLAAADVARVYRIEVITSEDGYSIQQEKVK